MSYRKKKGKKKKKKQHLTVVDPETLFMRNSKLITKSSVIDVCNSNGGFVFI